MAFFLGSRRAAEQYCSAALLLPRKNATPCPLAKWERRKQGFDTIEKFRRERGGGREPFLKGSLPRFHIHTLLFLSPLHTLNVFNFLLLGLFGELAEDEHIDAAAFGRLKGKFGTREGAVPARITERTKT